MDPQDYQNILYLIKKTEFQELVSIKVNYKIQPNVDALIKISKEIQDLTSNQNFKQLMYLLSFEKITDHPLLTNWTVEIGRIQCFDEIRIHLETNL